MPGEPWGRVPLGDLAQKVGSGATPRGGSEAYQPTGTPLIRSQNVHFNGFRWDGLAFIDQAQAQALDGVTVQDGDVLLNITGASIGRVTRAPPAMAGARVNQHVCIIRADECRLSAGFLNYFLSSASQQAVIMAEEAGQTRQALTKSQILAFQVPLPPLPEQKKIAAILSSVDEAIQATQAVIDQTRRVKEGLLQDLLTRGLPGHTRFKQTEIGEIPEGWEVKRLGSVAEVCNGSTPSRSRPDYWDGGTIPWVASGKVNDFVVTQPSEYITKKAYSECSVRLLPVGTVIVGMIGQGRTRGMCAMVLFETTINQNIAGVVAGPELHPEYLFAYLTYSYEGLRASGRGSNQDAMNCSIVKAFPLALPPLPEQGRIVEILKAVDTSIAAAGFDMAALSNAKAGLLQDLLTGRVRVTP